MGRTMGSVSLVSFLASDHSETPLRGQIAVRLVADVQLVGMLVEQRAESADVTIPRRVEQLPVYGRRLGSLIGHKTPSFLLEGESSFMPPVVRRFGRGIEGYVGTTGAG